ncbi:MAG: hypothetical protein PHV51_06975 [Methanosarcinaceae archaeon]|nr:hypothetical protein [Methanosarcinaceae archaeon]
MDAMAGEISKISKSKNEIKGRKADFTEFLGNVGVCLSLKFDFCIN